MIDSELDQILALQIAVARLGERPLRFWWNSDIADIDGGADLLVRLVGKESAPLSVIQALLQVAKQTEERLCAAVPSPLAYSLFCPEPTLRRALHNRIQHFKSYPDELPESFHVLLSQDYGESNLLSAITNAESINLSTGSSVGGFQTEDTVFGVELKFFNPMVTPEAVSPVKYATILAAVAASSPKGAYTLPYYREVSDV